VHKSYLICLGVLIGGERVTFPLETEATIRRRMLDICQDHARKVVDITRELNLMFDTVAKRELGKAKERYEVVLKMLDESSKMKTTLLEEVASVGSLSLNREDFLRLIFRVGEIADNAEAIGFRLAGIMEKKWKVEKNYLKRISDLMSLVLEEITRMRETMLSLGFNPSKAIELSKAVEEIERRIDSTYRTLDIDILDSKMPIQSMLYLRDIVQHLEEMADLGVDVIVLIRVLAV